MCFIGLVLVFAGAEAFASFAVTIHGTMEEFKSSDYYNGCSPEASAELDDDDCQLGGVGGIAKLGLDPEDGAINICLLAVLPEFRRQGIASLMCKQITQSAKSVRASAVFLHMMITNITAARFYSLLKASAVFLHMMITSIIAARFYDSLTTHNIVFLSPHRASAVFLHVMLTNMGAARFYDSLNFKAIGVVPNYYQQQTEAAAGEEAADVPPSVVPSNGAKPPPFCADAVLLSLNLITPEAPPPPPPKASTNPFRTNDTAASSSESGSRLASAATTQTSEPASQPASQPASLGKGVQAVDEPWALTDSRSTSISGEAITEGMVDGTSPYGSKGVGSTVSTGFAVEGFPASGNKGVGSTVNKESTIEGTSPSQRATTALAVAKGLIGGVAHMFGLRPRQRSPSSSAKVAKKALVNGESMQVVVGPDGSVALQGDCEEEKGSEPASNANIVYNSSGGIVSGTNSTSYTSNTGNTSSSDSLQALGMISSSAGLHWSTGQLGHAQSEVSIPLLNSGASGVSATSVTMPTWQASTFPPAQCSITRPRALGAEVCGRVYSSTVLAPAVSSPLQRPSLGGHRPLQGRLLRGMSARGMCTSPRLF
eukprot:gene23159-30366_t